MATWSRQQLSGSSNGLPIPINASSSPGTTIHGVSTATTTKDAVYVWAFNMATTQSQVTAEMFGTASNFAMTQILPALSGAYAIVPGDALTGGTATGSSSGNTLTIFATASNRVSVFGYVDRAT